mgnify:FL=1
MKKRNYKKEYKAFHAKPKQRKLRGLRDKARRIKKLKVGDSREVDHKQPLSKGGSNANTNLRITSRSKNRRKGAS